MNYLPEGSHSMIVELSSFWIDVNNYGYDFETLLDEVGYGGLGVVSDHYSFL